MASSLHCSSETITIVISYTPIKSKKKKRKERKKNDGVGYTDKFVSHLLAANYLYYCITQTILLLSLPCDNSKKKTPLIIKIEFKYIYS